MRILGIGEFCELGSMYLRLMRSGHEVRVFVGAFEDCGTMDGMVPRVASWRDQLPWIREAGDEGVIVFEEASDGITQDALRRDGYFVIGGGSFGDRMEHDRDFAQKVLASLGLLTAPAQAFQSADEACAFIRSHPQRYVFKLNGSEAASWRNYVGQADDGSDVIGLLRANRARLSSAATQSAGFLLMQHVTGVETGVGAYFNGEAFLRPACIDWEHKRFFAGNLGELTGEMGTLVSYRDSEPLFSLTLAKLAPLLREHGYVGYINLNTIINEQGVWPLELTCRFGYPGFAILDALQPQGWAALFAQLRDRESLHLDTLEGFSVGVVLTVPPYPYRYGYEEISKGLPIFFHPELNAAEHEALHLVEVALADEQLITSGVMGNLMVATGVGANATEARHRAYALAGKVIVPNVRYRCDIAENFIRSDARALQQLGYLGAPAQQA